MANGRHRKKRSWFWTWFLAALIIAWGGIWASSALRPSPAALQRPSHYVTQPVHVIRARPSQSLKIPTAAIVVTVSQGQTLWSIAHQYCGDGSKYRKIANENMINGWIIQPGQKVKVEC